ncbi:MAG: cold-shock protein [Candidatus Nitrosocosmicus sp.]
MNGQVKWFNDKRGYGFITDGKEDYFAHFKSIQSDGFKTLTEGQKVTFTPGFSAKGKIAENISVIG